jgi:protein ImuB
MRRILCIRLPTRSPRQSPNGPAAPETGQGPAERSKVRSQKKPAPASDLGHPLGAWTRDLRLLTLCLRYSPLVGWAESDNPDSLLLDVTGCAHLFGGEEQMARQISRDFQQLRFAPRIAIADTIGAAWAVARYGSASRSTVVPVGRLAEALGPLPVEALRISARIVEVLHELGIETIGQLTALPRETLPSRFGPEIIRRLDQAFGHVPEPIACQRPFEPLEATWGCEPPIESGPAIEAVLRKLLDRLIGRIQARQEGILQFDVELNIPQSEPARFSVGLVRPTLNEKRLLELTRLQLERMQLRGKVGNVKLAVTRSARLDIEQSALFETSDRRNARRDLDSLLNRLSNRLGEEAVLTSRLCPDFQPERGVEYRPVMKKRTEWDRRSDAENRSLAPPRQRPLRLFPRPQPATVWSVVPNGPPIRLCWRDVDQKIIRCEGPERIETGWWRPEACRRDYFRAEIENGRRLWLFHSHDEESWFVHGEF